jgi:hypothetical protein
MKENENDLFPFQKSEQCCFFFKKKFYDTDKTLCPEGRLHDDVLFP